MCQDERIKEACGVFGIYNPHGEDAASSIYYGLSSLQHRGQESCGIAVFYQRSQGKYECTKRDGTCQ